MPAILLKLFCMSIPRSHSYLPGLTWFLSDCAYELPLVSTSFDHSLRRFHFGP
jgi:hypothetical protein